jgi:hypothetical protein
MLYGLLASTGLLARKAGRENETMVFGPYTGPMLVYWGPYALGQ